MKKTAITAFGLILALGSAISCTTQPATGSSEAAANVDTVSANDAPSTLNIRYIDGDSLAAKYNLAKDFNEAYIRSLSRLEQARQSKANEINRFGNQIQQRMQSNGYLSEATYNADVQKLQKMQADAENYIANMSRSAENELAQQQLQLHDSIENYILIYNSTRGYDAILLKQAGLYFNPALDITDEIVEGLNARYNKVADKK
ncbi:MAG: OmpH family outer membrane protein [Bacteroides sp.]|nr:OmpH family outer membrane protein [Barnesiella sp.]MBD5254160.1 OmpH family outer membrane protein [Barnesiella sp.]MBD5344002.1 OmpH family outer membrane protein [Bacteroides sp.]MBD5369261.1 OmpH family outer membrane protein [Bacteroides sp.]MDE5828485.1 OmpH family outer membrane protein [Duncaniella sp.]